MSRFVKLTFNWHRARQAETQSASASASCAADTQKQISINTHANEQSCHHAQMPIEMTAKPSRKVDYNSRISPSPSSLSLSLCAASASIISKAAKTP